MIRLLIAFAWISIFLFSCATHKKSISHSTTDDRNNVISNTNQGGVIGKGSGDNIIFEGENNLFELIQKNAAYFDKTRDVIIIKGNGNIIKLYNVNIVDFRRVSADTLVIVGNNVKYVMCVKNEIALKKSVVSTGTIEIKNKEFDPASLNEDLQEKKEYLIKINVLLERIKNGEANAYFELAEMYNYGHDETPISTDKAIDLYEYGAVRGDIQSIRRLGDIWFNGSFDKTADKTKGRYYYKLGAQLGDSYCMEESKKL